jgi:outer membrane protein assembly factor BamB
MLVGRLVAILALVAGCATTVRGVVYVDHNRDGQRQRDEPGVVNVRVALDDHSFTTTRSDGSFAFVELQSANFAWARVPDGFRAAAAFARADMEADIALQPLSAKELAAPLTFVVAADTHATTSTGAWDGGDLEDAIAQAVALPEPPRFFTIVGDVTQGNALEEFSRVDAALQATSVPWVLVPGNHDWYDGGAAWRARLGPDTYSFDIGEVHVVVWDTNRSSDEQLSFFENELADIEPSRIVIALGHESPNDAIADRLADLGVDYLFTGHWHANRRIERRGMVEWGTQTMVMGSIDQSPAGYRIVTFHDGVPIVEHRARMVTSHVALSSPHAGSCAPTSGFELLASASLDATLPSVSARIDCGPPIALSPRGGWAFGVNVTLPPGTHNVELVATTPSGRTQTTRAAFEVCDVPQPVLRTADWRQPGGGASHTNATALPIAPPLAQLWATTLGNNIVLGTPLVAGDTVVINVWDLGAGDGGGVVALDLATGAIRWRHTTPVPVRAPPAIAGDTVVIALSTGEVHAVALADGALRWTHDVGRGLDATASSLWGSPVVTEDTTYVAVQGRIAALAVGDGAVRWERDLPVPEYAWLGSLAAITLANDTAFANVGRWNGMSVWSAASGTARFNLTGGLTTAINSTPVASDDTLYIANAEGDVTAYELATMRRMWTSRVISGETNEWMYTITAPMALAANRLIVPTQYRDLVALDATTGAEVWRSSTPGGPLSFAHYRAAEPGFAAGAVVTNDIVWVPRPDGVLSALALADGSELWSTRLGAPIVSSPAPAGDILVVATFDGTLRALAPGNVRPVPEAPTIACEPIDVVDAGGCCEGAPGGSLPSVMAMALLLRRRRRIAAR